jgi:hypothetical protein
MMPNNPRDFSLGFFLCKNHPLDDLQENSLLAKHEKIAEMCCRFQLSRFSPVKVFGRPYNLASHWLVGGSSLKDDEKC